MRGISYGWNSGRQIFWLETLRLDWLGLPNVRTTHATEGHAPAFFEDQHEPRSGWYAVGSYHSRIRKEPFKLPNESMCITIPVFFLQILIQRGNWFMTSCWIRVSLWYSDLNVDFTFHGIPSKFFTANSNLKDEQYGGEKTLYVSSIWPHTHTHRQRHTRTDTTTIQ